VTYTRELVEFLLPAVWDPFAHLGMIQPTAPEHDMPRGSTNKAHGNTLYAHLVDIRDAWRRTTELTPKERRALLLRFGLDLTEQEVGRHEGVTKQTISTRLFTGVGKLVAQLNGTEFSEELDAA
jgi:DNA-directed RNA polymerase specialized sigma24 family protein